MKIVCGLLLLCFVSFIITQETPYWSDWKQLSPCTAKPCNCHPEKKDNTCDNGKEVQVRFCYRSKNDTGPCPYDNSIGPIRQVDCINNNRSCPFWSEWTETVMCYDEDEQPFKMQKERVCQNQYGDLKCYDPISDNLDGDVEYEVDPFQCFAAPVPTAAPTTTTTVATTTIPAECQENEEYQYDYNDGEEEEEEEKKPSMCDYIYQY